MKKKKVQYDNLSNVPEKAWKKLSEKTIYFGHQSVGFNIIDGIKALENDYPALKLDVIEVENDAEIKKGMFSHSRIGENGDSIKKIEDFNQKIRSGIGKKVDIAFFKLCYADITNTKNPIDIFEKYTQIMAGLKKDYPDVSFIHFTTPLTVSKTTWKTWLKKIIGIGELYEIKDNIKRNEYNNMIINHYKGIEPIFDLARIESTVENDKRVSFTYKNNEYYSLFPGYTTDGGHLNEIGRNKTAKELLLILLSN